MNRTELIRNRIKIDQTDKTTMPTKKHNGFAIAFLFSGRSPEFCESKAIELIEMIELN